MQTAAMAPHPVPPPAAVPPAPAVAPAVDAAAVKSRHLMGQLSSREFLQRIFPAVNPNVLELVWQGCGGNLERAIEQIVSNNSMSNLHAAHMAQQMALQHRLMAAQMAAVAGGKLPGGGALPPGAASRSHSGPKCTVADSGTPVCQAALQKSTAQQPPPPAVKPVGSSESAFTAPVGKPGLVAPAFPGFPVGHPAALAGLYSYQAAQAALMARVCPPNGQAGVVVPPQPQHGALPNNATPLEQHGDLLAQKSAFSSHRPCDSARSPAAQSASSPGSSSASPRSADSGTPAAPSPSIGSPQSSDGAKSPIKFSVESIIGK